MNQYGGIDVQKLQQVVGEIDFPVLFAFVPWGHHVQIITKCKDVEEALFYIKGTIREGWSRTALTNCIKADLYHNKGSAITNFDMLFYHIKLRCYVVVELKVVSFDPEFVGKLNFYVNAVDDLIKNDSDNPTIGLLICKDMNQTEVQWAFRGIETPMGVATYDNVRIKELEEHLPSVEAIQARIHQAEEEFRLIMKQ